MNAANINEAILRFFRDDVGGILITDSAGNILYSDEQTAFVREDCTGWKAACPPPAPGQKKEIWDFMCSRNGRSYMVTTSAFSDADGLKQIHFLADTSHYTGLFRDITDYSKYLQVQKDHDAHTGLFSKARYLEMKRNVFAKQETVAVFNFDINNLKQTNDRLGHAAGDRLIRKAAESLKRIEARNIIPFRVGGDEFLVVAIHVTREEAEAILRRWQEGLAELNRLPDGVHCAVACGFAYGEKGFDLEEVLALAYRRMYEDKKALKDNP